jgi:hypothetical protein
MSTSSEWLTHFHKGAFRREALIAELKAVCGVDDEQSLPRVISARSKALYRAQDTASSLQRDIAALKGAKEMLEKQNLELKEQHNSLNVSLMHMLLGRTNDVL